MYASKKTPILLFLLLSYVAFSQPITLYKQFNGPYDYTAFGNTLNLAENGAGAPCDILTQSSATFQLASHQEVIAAYLYWAGSGPGDFEVTFNQTPIIAERTFNFVFDSQGIDYEFFAAFTDVTEQVQATGNGTYTLSDLDLTDVIPSYCSPPGNATNFGGWAVMVVYEDPNLSLNQVNVFDGLESVNRNNQSLTINLNNLLISQTEGAKIGFLAWEGDREIAVNETLRINGHILGNPPLNPPNNAFNGTNSFTGSDQLYNMDIDYYNISDYINTGDQSAVIQLTSGQDFVMISNIITVLNSELPDASISIDQIDGDTECGNRELTIDYTVYNSNSTAHLPIATPIAFYADDTLIAQAETQTEIPINGEEVGSITITIPENIGPDFILKLVVDDIGDGTGIVMESNEDNNEDETPIRLLLIPDAPEVVDLETCETLEPSVFDLTNAIVRINPDYDLSFHLYETDAINDINPIVNPENFYNTDNPQTIYIRVSNPDCFITDSFTITVNYCPLPDASIDFLEVNACRGRELLVPYTVYNLEATGPLPANIPIAFYGDDIFLGLSYTRNSIPVGESEEGEVWLSLPEELLNPFILKAVVDDDGYGNSSIQEWRKDNNSFERTVRFESIPPIPDLPNLLKCNEGFEKAVFDLTEIADLIRTDSDDEIHFFTSAIDASENINPILNPGAYQNTRNPQQIFVRLDNDICFAIAHFLIETENCAPFIPQGFSPNGDGINDVFEISNLLDIYPDFELRIYSRNGNLIHVGRNPDGFWNGVATRGYLFRGNKVPVGTYFYTLHLNHPDYPKPFVGWVYINY